MSDKRWEGKSVLVTGASKGLGAAIAQAFGQEGARVGIVFHRSASAAERVAASIRSGGSVAEMFRADVGSPEDVRRLRDEIEGRWGRLDVLVNNAGVTGRTPEGIDAEAWDEVLNPNARGAYLLTQAFAPLLRGSGKGAVLFVASDAVITGSARSPPYAASKAAVLALTKSYAVQLAPSVRVNAVVPGFMDTETIRARADMTPERVESLRRATPLGELIRPAEVAALALFLCSDAASAITGEAVLINGGRVLW